MQVSRQKELPYSPEQLFALVDDVEQYPQFVPWCRQVDVLSQTEDEVIARLCVSKNRFLPSFTTRNHRKPFQCIEMRLEEGPFKSLHGRWTFEPHEVGVLVTLEVAFSFHSPLMKMAVTPVFQPMILSMMDAFEKRAHALYGSKS